MAGRKPKFQGKEREEIIAKLKEGQTIHSLSVSYSCPKAAIAKIKREEGIGAK